MGRKLLDVSDLSIDGIRIPKKGTPRPPRKVTVSLGGRGDVVRQTYEITITRSIPRGNSWVLLTTNGRENSIFEKLVDAIIESRSMVPMPRRSGALLPTVGRPPIACDLESQTCPAHAVSCPQAACTTPSMISGACRGGHGRILNANVVEACLIEERTALLEKFNRTTKALAPTWIEGARGILSGSSAVIACQPLTVLNVLESHLTQPNFHENRETRLSIPRDDRWKHRPACDEILFDGYKEEIRFAALSLDGRGVKRFGRCFVRLKESVVSRRASVFYENSVIAIENETFKEAAMAIRGCRASWQHRDDLVLTKLSAKLGKASKVTSGAFRKMLLVDGRTADKDQFVEVHVYGKLFADTFAEISLPRDHEHHSSMRRSCRRLDIPFVSR